LVTIGIGGYGSLRSQGRRNNNVRQLNARFSGHSSRRSQNLPASRVMHQEREMSWNAVIF
jgi:hypothetical protein